MFGRRESRYTATLAFSGMVLSIVFIGCSPVSRDSSTHLASVSDYQVPHNYVFFDDDNGNPEGLVALRWDPAVQEQLHKLLQALGRAFDGKIAGINLQETAIGVSEEGRNAPAGFTYAGYRDAIRSNITALRQAFSSSLPMQYINYMPGEWLPDDDHSYMRSLFEYGHDIGVAVGAPDLMPQNPNQKKHAYRFMRELTDTMVLGVAVQDGNYGGTTGADNAPTEPGRISFRSFSSSPTATLASIMSSGERKSRISPMTLFHFLEAYSERS